MRSDNFVESLERKGHQRAGLCMFAPAILASISNRLLQKAYADGGNNLSVPMCDIMKDGSVRYLAGNYSSASLVHVKNTIDELEKIPGAIVLITASGVGAKAAQTMGLMNNGQVGDFEKGEHSFYSFAENFLSVRRCETEVEIPKIEDLAESINHAKDAQYGTEGEIAARRELLKANDHLEALIVRAVEPESYGGIGHNRPPHEKILPINIAESINQNINIIRSEIQSESPDAPRVIHSANIMERVWHAVVQFFDKTAEHLKSDGSRALAAAIISGIGWVIWQAVKWISTVFGFPIL